MSAYGQVKRQKVREARPGENVDYFQGIDKVEYNNMAGSADAGAYRYYGAGERVHSRALDDWLKYSVALGDLRNNGSNPYARPPHRPWDDGTNTLDNHKRCIKALFDLCTKLGVKYWTAFDTDLVPSTDSWDESRQHWDEVVEYVQELSQRTHVRLLWLAPDLHSHPRYTCGALTSSEATTFAQAAAQIKKCLEVCQRLNGECFVLWPQREGCDGWLQDVPREIKLLAKLLRLTAEYKDRLSYRCQLLLMPYQSWQGQGRSDDVVHRYMWDVTSCLYLLKTHGLERHYRVCSPPGHHIIMASVYNMLGGVMVTNEQDLSDNKKLALMMKCIIDQGTPLAGGVCVRVRSGADAREAAAAHVRAADALARALRRASSLLNDQTYSKHLQQRYSSYYSGFGSRLVSAEVSMEECEDYYKKNQSQHSEPPRVASAALMLQRCLDSADHV